MKLDTQRLQTLDQVREFLAGSRPLDLQLETRAEAYAFVAETLQRFDYSRQGKADKGLIRRFLNKVTGLSRAQVTRLLHQHRTTGAIADRRRPRHPFPRRYTKADIGLLAEVDALHGTLSGPATRKLCVRALQLFGDRRFERLAAISNGHLYNLRHSTSYQRRRGTMPAPTRPVHIAIGERRRPQPSDNPATCGSILSTKETSTASRASTTSTSSTRSPSSSSSARSSASTRPASPPSSKPCSGRSPLTSVDSTPTTVRSSSTTKSSPGCKPSTSTSSPSPDPAAATTTPLVESKNGSVIRKHLGYGHIPSRYAERVNAFTQQVLSPYLNFHRPCLFPVDEVDAKGRVRKRYPHANVMTPYEKLKSLPNAAACLKLGTSFDQLDAVAAAMSDSDAARALNQARDRLFASIDPGGLKHHAPGGVNPQGVQGTRPGAQRRLADGSGRR